MHGQDEVLWRNKKPGHPNLLFDPVAGARQEQTKRVRLDALEVHQQREAGMSRRSS